MNESCFPSQVDHLVLADLRRIAFAATAPTDDEVFAGIDSEQPLGEILVGSEDTGRVSQAIRDTLDGPDRLEHDDVTLRPT